MTRAKPLRRDAALNREKLTAAAALLFAERGAEVPLDEIARRAEVSIGTLYNHFPTREALLDSIYPELVEGIYRDAGERLADSDPWQKFAGFLEQVFVLQAADRGLNDAMTMRYPNAQALVEACGRGFGVIEGITRAAKQAGALRQDFEMTDLAVLVWTISRVVRATEAAAPGAWRRVLCLHLDGLRAAAAHPIATPAMTTDQVAAVMQVRAPTD